jgi:hypothetical protein
MKTRLFPFFLLLWSLHAQSQENIIDERVIITEVSADESYGFTPKNNIKVGTIKNEYAFIAQLTGPNGEQISAVRTGSGWPVKSKNTPSGKAYLDKWQITYEGLSDPIIIYLNGYDYEQPKCPLGLGFTKLPTRD